jgi:hypothetical protein
MSVASDPSSARPRSARPWAILAFAIALPLLAFRSAHLREWEDEGYFANGALRVLAGQVVYRDFQHNYPPGRSYTLALLLGLFGHHLWVVRSFWVAVHAAAAAIGFLVARRLVSTPLALWAAGSIVLCSVFMNKSVELCLAAAILLVLCRVLERRTSDLAAGAWLALIGLYRHDVAVFGFVLLPCAMAGAQALDGWPGWTAVLRRVARGWRAPVGAAAVLAPWVVYLGVHGALGMAWRDLLESGLLANQLLSRPFPPPFPSFTPGGIVAGLGSSAILFWIPIATYAAALAVGLARLREPASRRAGAELCLVAAFGTLVFVQVLPRTDLGHLNKAYLPAYVAGVALVGAALDALRRALRERRPAAAVMAGAGLAAALYMPLANLALAVLPIPISIPTLLRERDRYVAVVVPRGRMQVLRGPAEKYAPLFELMAPYAGRAGEQLVVYPAGAMMNFLFDLPSPLRHDLLRPGEMAGQELGGELVPNHPEVLADVARRLAASRPRFLVDSAEATNEPLRGLVTAFCVNAGYRPLRGGRFTLWVRPDTPLPEGLGNGEGLRDGAGDDAGDDLDEPEDG